MRKAKIVCTIGPPAITWTTLDRLIEQGMNAARLNFSHGTHESHAAAIKTIRQAADHRRAPVAIIQDLQGPRIRVGEVAEGGIVLEERPIGAAADDAGAIRRTARPSIACCVRQFEIPVTYQHLAQDVRPGARILINDGLIELAVERISGGAIECKVVIGGTVTSHKGINLPGTRVSAPTLTDKDREDIRFGVAAGRRLCRAVVSSEGRTTSGRQRNSSQDAAAASPSLQKSNGRRP